MSRRRPRPGGGLRAPRPVCHDGATPLLTCKVFAWFSREVRQKSKRAGVPQVRSQRVSAAHKQKCRAICVAIAAVSVSRPSRYVDH